MTQKLVLKIKEKGHLVHLPGQSAPFRTPAEVDATHVPLNTLILLMQNHNIQDYEITSYVENKKVIYKKEKKKDKKQKLPDDADDGTKQYLKSLNKRFNRMENLIAGLFNKSSSLEKGQDPEQINERLERIEQLIVDRAAVKEVIYSTKEDTKKNPKIEEIDEGMFIPNIDVSGMKLKSSEHSEMDREEDVDETADLLSQISKKKKLEE